MPGLHGLTGATAAPPGCLASGRVPPGCKRNDRRSRCRVLAPNRLLKSPFVLRQARHERTSTSTNQAPGRSP
ncbi:MAG: hypothetical protein MZV70_63545 [Desulfobacterales bacterium]|nr:hypothetical protein [Desulfobacterales bacterium]